MNSCPLKKPIPRSCFECDYTAQIGSCWYPTPIQKEIEEGRASPPEHEYSWPERELDFQRRIKEKVGYKLY